MFDSVVICRKIDWIIGECFTDVNVKLYMVNWFRVYILFLKMLCIGLAKKNDFKNCFVEKYYKSKKAKKEK